MIVSLYSSDTTAQSFQNSTGFLQQIELSFKVLQQESDIGINLSLLDSGKLVPVNSRLNQRPYRN